MHPCRDSGSINTLIASCYGIVQRISVYNSPFSSCTHSDVIVFAFSNTLSTFMPMFLIRITHSSSLYSNIDVLWIKRHFIVRAFEVEGTNSAGDLGAAYYGILRMADLSALQPMLDIKIHIVASIERRKAVFEQINRPVFAFMEKRSSCRNMYSHFL